MLRKLIASAALVGASTSAFALNSKDYAGTWAGTMPHGQPVILVIPANVDKGGSVSYTYDGKSQGPQKPTVQGSSIKLTNPGNANYMIVGPVKAGKMSYFWTDGSHQAKAVLSKQ